MKTKALLLAGLVTLAGAFASQAQTVYSVNAVGFVNVSLQPGFSLISNPLQGSDNKITTLFANVATDGMVIYKFNTVAGNFVANNYFGGWSDTAMTLSPGEGAFVFNPNGTAATITFTGEVLQGTLSTTLGAGFSLVGSKVPQAGQLDTLMGLPIVDGDIIYRFQNGSYIAHNYFGGWNTPPTVQVAEGFFVFKSASANWTRTFSVSGS